jgi:hypothetical protein
MFSIQDKLYVTERDALRRRALTILSSGCRYPIQKHQASSRSLGLLVLIGIHQERG